MMVDLTNLEPIGKGTNRLCFIHPYDENKCIKITHSKDFSETNREIKYYKFLQKRNINWQALSKYYGSIDTSMGKGEVFDLIRDHDGSISKTLSFYLKEEENTKSIENPLVLLQKLKEYTLSQNIVVKDLNTKNMLYQKSSKNTGKLVLIDGLSNNGYFSFSKNIPFFTQKKIKKLWKNFEESLPRKYSFNKYFINLLNQKS